MIIRQRTNISRSALPTVLGYYNTLFLLCKCLSINNDYLHNCFDHIHNLLDVIVGNLT